MPTVSWPTAWKRYEQESSTLRTWSIGPGFNLGTPLDEPGGGRGLGGEGERPEAPYRPTRSQSLSPVVEGRELHGDGRVLLHVLGPLVELLAELGHVQTQRTQRLADRGTRLR